ncbi:DsbA family protein [Roseateles sp. BYS78W]|uniref:DsbA family protein n=1 Tax=Pelomonas candidula TaxID=3299025 RepID=A0ABW7H8M2_9BURK
MDTPTLHYIHDPLCGWCYGAAPLVKAARERLPVRAHGGGMMAGPARRPVTAELRGFVLPHDQRIAQLSGQPFGAAYRDGLLNDTSAVFDSEPPIAAVLAADAVAGRGLDLLARLQTAHYVEGRRIANRAVLEELAADIGLDAEAFTAALSATEGDFVQRHIGETRTLMQRLGVRGFPSFVLEQAGSWRSIDIGPFMGQPAAFGEWLQGQVPAGASASAFQCGPDGCAI